LDERHLARGGELVRRGGAPEVVLSHDALPGDELGARELLDGAALPASDLDENDGAFHGDRDTTPLSADPGPPLPEALERDERARAGAAEHVEAERGAPVGDGRDDREGHGRRRPSPAREGQGAPAEEAGDRRRDERARAPGQPAQEPEEELPDGLSQDDRRE